MMEWLGSWLQEIVLIVLFATFIELLLPNHSMQRYVKVVLSLLVLLTILQPIVRLLQSDWQMEHLLQGAQQTSVTPTGNEIRPLSDIMAEAAHIQQKQQEDSIQIVQSRINEETLQGLRTAGWTQVQSVQSTLEVTEENQPQLTSIEVVVGVSKQEQDEGEQQRPNPTENGKHHDQTDRQDVEVKPVEPVTPVQVHVPHETDRLAAPDVPEKAEGLIKPITAWVTERWEIEEKRVHVVFIEDNVHI
ncbi:stage III sporulation protein AF [Marinicrinis sediminis]|uniref:Stage III sporulation protein AF n=1 Tax=Marinicrinis sediminis TaxID=1652465 RepID=A0ABW5RCT5_9BACL